MADDANLTAGDGSLIAGADDVGGVKYPRVKVNFGTDGSRIDVDGSHPLPVAIYTATGSPGTVPIKLPGTATVVIAAGSATIGTVKLGALINSTATIGVVKLGAGSATVGTFKPGALINSTATIGVVKLGAGTATVGTFKPGALINSTATIGVVKLGASSATVGSVKLSAGANAIGSLTNTTATIGVVKLGAGSAAIGSLTNTTATIGVVKIGAGSAAIGSLTNSTATIGVVKLSGGTATIGKLGNTTATIGVVKLGSSSATVGSIKLSAGTNAIGSLTGGTATIGFTKAGTATTGALAAPAVTLSSATEKVLQAAGGSGVFWDLYGLMVVNTSTTYTLVAFRDNTTSGTKRYISAPARDTRGIALHPQGAIQQGTSNKGWSVTATGGSVTSLQITGLFVKRK